jgi:hypothetical protein
LPPHQDSESVPRSLLKEPFLRLFDEGKRRKGKRKLEKKRIQQNL